MSEEITVPEIGTPEYDAHMLNVHNESQEKFKEPTLPEGVTLEDLLKLHAAQGEEKVEEELPTGGEEGEVEEAPKEEEPKEDLTGLEALEQKVKDMEDAAATIAIHQAAGSEEDYNTLRENAEKTLSTDQLALMNMALVDGTQEQAVAAVGMLKALLAGNPDAPNIEGKFLGGNGGLQESNAYSSATDLHAAQADPKYRMNNAIGEAYRADVVGKLQRSKF